MGISINLEFGDGDFERGFEQNQLVVTVTTFESEITQIAAQLSPSPEIPESYQRWKNQYYSLLQKRKQRGFKNNQFTHISSQDCGEQARTLRRQLHEWLQPLNLEIQAILQQYPDEEIHLVIHTPKVASSETKDILHRLPWQEWDLFQDFSSNNTNTYPNKSVKNYIDEAALCFKSYEANTAVAFESSKIRRVRIISIFGDSEGIDTGADKELLSKLKKRGTELIYLTEPSRADFNTLWEEACDILFFAGHSETKSNGQAGVININRHESLSLTDIKKTLGAAIGKGLKLAIFNSCDGLGLARELADLNLPYIIVWREVVPDVIAQKFIRYFLSSFASGKSLFASVREAKDKLFELAESQNSEKQLPGVTWLPIICQNTIEPPPSWSDLGGLTGSLPDNPYRGLSAFREEDAEFYFGREEYIADLVEAVYSKPLVPVIGASGSGKSSVVFAGLVPRLRTAPDVQIISFRPENKPFDNLAIALSHLDPNREPYNTLGSQLDNRLAQIGLDLDWRHDETKLCDYIRTLISASGYQRLVLIADQFEELYTLTPEVERQSFLKALYFAVKYAPNFTLVLTLRADFLGIVLNSLLGEALKKYAPLLLTPMNSQELRSAIEKPAVKMKVELQKGLTFKLINDLGSHPGRLPLLEFALTQLWEKQENWYLTHQAYEEIGGLEKALAKHADEVLDELQLQDLENRYKAERIFIQLVSSGAGTEDTRRVATRQEVGLENWDLVQKLASQRLVVTGRDETNAIETVEIVHEALIREWGTLRKWIQDNREFRTWQERLRGSMRQWQKMRQDEGALLGGAALVEAEERLKERQDDLSQDEQDYIKQSIELRECLIKQDNERRKRQFLAASIATMFFAGLSIFSAFEWRNSEINQIDSLTESSEALLASNQKLDALISSLYAGKKLNQPLLQIFPPTTKLKDKVKRTLQKVVYQVQERNRLNGHQNVNSIEVNFSLDNQHLVTAGEDGTIKLWNFQGQPLLTWQNKLPTNCISISPNGQIVATAGNDGIITLWNLKGQQLTTWKGNQGWIRSISFSPNGQLLATGGSDGTRLWNLQGQQLAKLESDQGWVWSVRFSPNGQLLASGGYDGTIRLWNLQGQQLAKLTGHEDKVRSVSFSPDGQKLATAGDDGTVRLWNLQGQQLTKWQRGERGVSFVSFSPDGQKLAIAGHGTSGLWDLQGKHLSEFTHHKGRIRSMSFSLDSKRLATAGIDDTVYLWDLQDKHLSEFVQHQSQVKEVSFSLDGQRLATVGDDRTIHVWNLQGQESKAIKGHVVSFSQDGKQIATAGDDGTVSLWDFQGKQSFKFTAHQGQVRKVSFSSDSQRLATVGDDRIIRLWNLQGQKLFQSPVLADANFYFTSLSFSPDTRLIAAVALNGSVSVWNLQGQKLVQSPILADVNSHFKSFSFSPDSRLIAAVAFNGSVSVWDLQSDKNTEKTILLGHPGGTSDVIFYSNSQQLATAGDDGTVRLWDLQGKQLSKFIVHQGLVRSLSLSPNGQQLATTGDDRIVRLWNLQGQQLAVFSANSRNVIFSPDGQRLATVGVDGTAKLWQIETFEELLKQGCSWVRDYLKNPNISKSEATLCNHR